MSESKDPQAEGAEPNGTEILPPMEIPRRSYLGAILGFLVMVALPVVLAGVYYATVAADLYVSEFRYALRQGTVTGDAGQGGGGGLRDPSALQVAQDSFILEDYILSPQAMLDLEDRVTLREMLGRDGGDPVRAYRADLPAEDLLDFWQSAVDVRYDVITGITSVDVAMYRPEDARAVAGSLVVQLREVVDALSAEAQADMLTYVNREVEDAEAQLEQRRKATETFRRENRLSSPDLTTAQVEAQIGDLRAQISNLRLEQSRWPPDSPRWQALQNDTDNLERQIRELRAQIGSNENADLSDLQNRFERLRSEEEIAEQSLISAIELRRQSRATAALAAVQLVVFVPPGTPLVPAKPVVWL
ncbi:MAG: hypothetical protein AAGI13_02375, partial [Pseudomonadota bacterium]